MNLLSKFTFLIAFVLMISITNAATWCYQESANTTNQTGIDGSCGLNYTGSYADGTVTPFYSLALYINYTKPSGSNATLSKVQFKHGSIASYNISLPYSCFSYLSNKVMLRMLAEMPGQLRTNMQCYNGSWNNVGVQQDVTISCVGGGTTYSKIIDGNWSSHIEFDGVQWRDCTVGGFYEEAMLWSRDAADIRIISPTETGVKNGTVLLNYTASIGNGLTKNVTIKINGVVNKTENISTDNYYTLNMSNLNEGNNTVLIYVTDNSSINASITFAYENLIIFSYDPNPYEISTTTISALIEHNNSIKSNTAILNYNGTLKNMTITQLNSTHDNATISFITDFIDGGALTRNYSFYLNVTFNDSSQKGSRVANHILNVGYYINNITTPSYGSSGQLITQNISVTNIGGIAIAIVYANNSEIGNILGTQLNPGTLQNWTVSFNLPSVTVATNKTIRNYLKVQYGSVLAYRFFNDTNITVYPIEVGLCGGAYTVMILNYSGWNEQNNSQQITTNNYWETKLDIIAVNGTAVTTLGFNSTTSLHQICIKPNFSYYMNVSTYLSNNYSNYVRRSHFILNQLMSNATTNQIKIYLLNASQASIIDFYVKNAFDKVQANRIIKVYKFFPETNSYSELFNLLTDVNGHAVGYLKAYDQWYKIVVINSAGAITKTIPSTQFSVSTYTIIESAEGGNNAPLGITYIQNWDSVSKIFSMTVASLNSNNFKLTLDEVGFYGNTTYCTTTGTGTTVLLYCDMSNSTLTDFKWTLWVSRVDLLGASKYYPVASGEVESVKTPPYGATGLILTGLLTVMASLMFLRDAKIGIIMVMVSLTVCRAMQFIMISETALVALWAVALVLIYIMRGDRGG